MCEVHYFIQSNASVADDLQYEGLCPVGQKEY